MKTVALGFMFVLSVVGSAIAVDQLEYKNAAYGITMSYPADWKNNDVGSGVWFSPKAQKSMTPALILAVDPLPADIMDLNTLTDKVLSSFKQQYSPDGFSAPVDTVLGGVPAREINYQNKYQIKHVWIIALKDGKMYQAWFQGRDAKFDSLLPTVRQMLATYAFAGN